MILSNNQAEYQGFPACLPCALRDPAEVITQAGQFAQIRQSSVADALIEGGVMKIGKHNVKMFKIKNRTGFAAVCADHLTEGKTKQQAYGRMVKAVHRRKKRTN